VAGCCEHGNELPVVGQSGATSSPRYLPADFIPGLEPLSAVEASEHEPSQQIVFPGNWTVAYKAVRIWKELLCRDCRIARRTSDRISECMRVTLGVAEQCRAPLKHKHRDFLTGISEVLDSNLGCNPEHSY
jgi:hypothetical protein